MGPLSLRLLIGGTEGSRTHDLMHAMHVLSQLSYSPVAIFIIGELESAPYLLKLLGAVAWEDTGRSPTQSDKGGGGWARTATK